VILLLCLMPVVLGAGPTGSRNGEAWEHIRHALKEGAVGSAWDQFLAGLESEWPSYGTAARLEFLDLGVEACLLAGDPYLGQVILGSIPEQVLRAAPDLRLQHLLRKAELYIIAAQYELAEVYFEEALKALDESTDPSVLNRIFAQKAVLAWLIHQQETAASFAQRILLEQSGADLYSRAVASMILALVLDMTDADSEEVSEHLQRSRELFMEHAVPPKYYSLLNILVERHEGVSRSRTSNVLLGAMQQGVEADCFLIRSMAMAAQAESLRRKGALRDALVAIEESRRLQWIAESRQKARIVDLEPRLKNLWQTGSGPEPYLTIFLLLMIILVLVLILRIRTQRIINRRLVESVEKSRVAEAAAAHAMQLKSQFVSNVSHEIKTPMSGLVGMASILNELITDPVQRKYLATIRTCSANLLVMINDLLDLGRMETNRLEVEAEPFNVREMLDYCVQMVSLDAVRKGLDLRSQVEESVPEEVVGDAIRVGQIIVNLLNNGIKFTEEGSVTLLASFQRGPGESGRLMVSIKDTGRGIEPEFVRTVFEPFNQVDPSPEGSKSGTGLGLAISRKLTDLMGGTLSLTSEFGSGSEFKLNLPVRVAPETRENS
jgi:signal transduction histidine kinase